MTKNDNQNIEYIVIPAIDLVQGYVTRLQQGELSKAIPYRVTPTEIAQKVIGLGLNTVQLIDITAAKLGRLQELERIRELKALGLRVQYGGGIRTLSDARSCLEAGAWRVITGTNALTHETFLAEMVSEFGPEVVVLALDIKQGQAAIHGWESSLPMPIEFIIEKGIKAGVRNFLTTDISRDGMQQGVDSDFYAQLTGRYPDLNLIAAGGIGSAEDIESLRRQGIVEMVVGRAFYEDEALEWIKGAGR